MNHVAPKAAESSLWIVTFRQKDGDGVTWLDEIFEEPDVAIEEGLAQLEPDEEDFILVQLILDKDSPSKWAERLVKHLEGTVDIDDPYTVAAVDAVSQEIRDFRPQMVSELPTMGRALGGPRKKKERR